MIDKDAIAERIRRQGLPGAVDIKGTPPADMPPEMVTAMKTSEGQVVLLKHVVMQGIDNAFFEAFKKQIAEEVARAIGAIFNEVMYPALQDIIRNQENTHARVVKLAKRLGEKEPT